MADVDVDALEHARHRARGLESHQAGQRTPPGMRRLIEPGGQRVWWVPEGPDEVTPAVLRDVGLSPPAVERGNETCEVLACVLRLSWTGADESPWPGVPVSVEAVADLRAALRPTKDRQRLRDGAIGAARRLATSGWLLCNERDDEIRLGPRVASWTRSDLDQIAELCRTLPTPQGSNTHE